MFVHYSTDCLVEDGNLVYKLSPLKQVKDGLDYYIVRVTRDGGSKESIAELKMPERVWVSFSGFNDEELKKIRKYIISNESLMFDVVRGLINGN